MNKETERDIAYIIEYGVSEWSKAARVLRNAMACQAGRDVVEYGLLRPYGYTMTERKMRVSDVD